MENLTFTITGVAPLLMHNGQLADPAHPIVRKMKEISSKRKKVDADYEEMARLEWYGSLYLLEDKKTLCIPAHVFEACLIGRGSAARKERMGKQAAAGLWVLDDAALVHDGPKDIDKLWKDEQFRLVAGVIVASSRVMRTRPMFKKWGAEITITYNPTLVDLDALKRWIGVAGEQVGLMDWRPRFGRFIVEW